MRKRSKVGRFVQRQGFVVDGSFFRLPLCPFVREIWGGRVRIPLRGVGTLYRLPSVYTCAMLVDSAVFYGSGRTSF